MPRHTRFNSTDITLLRDHLSTADIDFGCRPLVQVVDTTFYIDAIVDESQLTLLAEALPNGILLEDRGEVESKSARIGRVSTSNRFISGDSVNGFGLKE